MHAWIISILLILDSSLVNSLCTSRNDIKKKVPENWSIVDYTPPESLTEEHKGQVTQWMGALWRWVENGDENFGFSQCASATCFFFVNALTEEEEQSICEKCSKEALPDVIQCIACIGIETNRTMTGSEDCDGRTNGFVEAYGACDIEEESIIVDLDWDSHMDWCEDGSVGHCWATIEINDDGDKKTYYVDIYNGFYIIQDDPDDQDSSRRRRLSTTEIDYRAALDFESNRDICCDDTYLNVGFSFRTDLNEGYCQECLDSCLCVDVPYEYINDGIGRTFEEARDYCIENFNSDLATIKTLKHLHCALENVEDGITPWIGLLSDSSDRKRNKPYFYTYSDGSSCPRRNNGRYSGACLDYDFWLNKEPLPCYIGSECVRALKDEFRINNDVDCDEKLQGVLCNPPDTGIGE